MSWTHFTFFLQQIKWISTKGAVTLLIWQQDHTNQSVYTWKIRATYMFIHVLVMVFLALNWWKGKPSGSIACTRKQQPRFYWSRSSVVMNDATPRTPPSAWAELHFQMSTTYMYTPWSLRNKKIWLLNDVHVVRGDFLQPPHRHKTPN